MNLIAYSDSEESDNDAPQPPKPAAKPAPKSTFQKVVDRSNPGKIKLNLPTPSRPQAEKDDIEAEAPPAKKARTGGGAFSGFNAMLPAPKKPNVNASIGGNTPGSRGLGKGLGSGVNLRTGAEPAFKRESKLEEEEEYDENGNPIQREQGKPMRKEDFRAMLNLPPPKAEVKAEAKQEHKQPEAPKVEAEVKAAEKPRFMPLSVARGKKKKPMAPRPAVAATEEVKTASATVTKAPATAPKPAARAKVSLFSVTENEDIAPTKNALGGNYQPLLYGADEEDEAPVPEEAFEEGSLHQPSQPHSSSAANALPGSQNLTNIASELNLTEAERRQLFGRKGRGPDLSGASIIEFNTDTEYAHNEKLRAQGETVQHNAVKAITGTGKNSLRSLINVATSQKDAMEEHFAAGRRNKKEAGNKYGW